VLHIKPQLEVLLRLDADALTKEIALTQALMDLFIKYQIPADLLSAPREAAALPGADRLAAVAANVAKIHAIIKALEDKELERAKAEARLLQPLEAPPSAERANFGGFGAPASALHAMLIPPG
jgi:hypothetical protein